MGRGLPAPIGLGPAVFREQQSRKGLLQRRDVSDRRVIVPSFYSVSWEKHLLNERLWEAVGGYDWGMQRVQLLVLRLVLHQSWAAVCPHARANLALNNRSK